MGGEEVDEAKRPQIKTLLPDPYGRGFSRNEDPLVRTKTIWESQDSNRLLYGKMAGKRIILFAKTLVGLGFAVAALLNVLFPLSASTSVVSVVLIWTIPILIATLPQLLATEYSWRALQTRISLREMGGFNDDKKHPMRSQPGMDRIIEGIKDNRRHNMLGVFFTVMAFILLCSAAIIEQGSIAWNLSLLVAMTSGIALIFHTQFTQHLMSQQGDKIPFLSFHAPTHHPTQVNTILGDLITAHLDPDSLLEWKKWNKLLAESIIPGNDLRQCLERLLYILHLQQQEEISTELSITELCEFLKRDTIPYLLFDEDIIFNWRSLQRLISHARAWQPGAFRLLDRLQDDLLSGSSSVLRAKWRMDVSLDPECDQGTGSLFIVLNNQTFSPRHVRVEVLCPGGEPELRTHRFELASCPPPRAAISLTDTVEDDGLDWIPRYLEKGVVLWIGVAWTDRFKGPANVQVILRDDDGVVLESIVVSTHVGVGESGLVKERKKNLELARKWGDSALPEVSLG
ncbi:MAG: hypothetical protein QMC50_03980 [Candidatus Poseidoniaceae archaeon]